MRRQAIEGDRKKFIRENKALFDKMNHNKLLYGDWKSKEGKEIIEKARRQLKYSDKTSSCDIFWNLMRLYKKIQDN